MNDGAHGDELDGLTCYVHSGGAQGAYFTYCTRELAFGSEFVGYICMHLMKISIYCWIFMYALDCWICIELNGDIYACMFDLEEKSQRNRIRTLNFTESGSRQTGADPV